METAERHGVGSLEPTWGLIWIRGSTDGKRGRSAGKASWSQIKEVLRGQEKEVELYQEDNIESNNVTSGVHFRNINLAD